MLFGGFVTDVVERVIKNRAADVKVFASDLTDGWELWLQVECFLILKQRESLLEFTREPRYPRGSQEADFSFRSKSSLGIDVFVELKTQQHNDRSKACSAFEDDILKAIAGLSRAKDAYGGAIVVAPVGGSTILAEMYPIADRHGWTEKVHYIALDGKDRFVGTLHETSNWPRSASCPVIMYLVALGK